MKKKLSKVEGVVEEDPELEGMAFNLVSAKNPIRVMLFKMVTSKYFDYFIIAVIILSAAILALDSPLQDP